MTPERWQQIADTFQSALRQNPSERGLFLDRACAGDEELRREIDALLTSHERVSGFMEEPAMTVAAKQGISGASLAGETVAHYQVLSLLGSGGMGDVYLAVDTKLGRRVALKLLPEYLADEGQRVSRFQLEARAASNLNHPNILTIYEIGRVDSRHFIATELIEGETLRQRLSRGAIETADALDIAVQVASALAAAHEVGVVHRDIKPDNIMIRRDRIAKVLDFGLAKLSESWPVEVAGGASTGTAEPTKMPVNTQPGVLMGTANYMSPEQARGSEVDARADIWSLGVVLYEMMAGRVPFEGETPADVLSMILHKHPPPMARYAPDTPDELDRIITKALTKDQESRYQTVKDLLIDLQRFRRRLDLDVELERTKLPGDQSTVTSSGGPTPTAAMLPPPTHAAVAHSASSAEYLVGEVKRHKWGVLLVIAAIVVAVVGFSLYRNRTSGQINSIAVLPLVNGSGDSNNDYLAEGITESLIDSLGQLPEVRVKSLNSVMRYQNTTADVQTVGRELGVEAVVTGRVTQRGDSLIVNVEMVNVSDNSRLWGARYDRKVSDLVVVQNEISREVVNKLRVRLTGEQEQRAASRYTENTEAYQLYLRGRYHWNRRKIEDLWKGLENFQRAIELDPNFALAWSGLADSYMAMVLGGPFSVWDSDKGQSTRTPMPLAEVRSKWGPAARRAVELGPDLAETHTSLGQGLEWLEWDLPGAEREYKRALELNPDYAPAHQRYGIFLIVSGRKDEGLQELKRALQLDPASLPINADLGNFYCIALGKPDEGIAQLKKTLELAPDWPRAHVMLSSCYSQKGMWDDALQEIEKAGAPGFVVRGRMYAATGQRDEALKIIAEMKTRPNSLALANVYTALGDKDQAFEWLEKALAERIPLMRSLPTSRVWDPLRSDPRFQDLLKRMGLPAASTPP